MQQLTGPNNVYSSGSGSKADNSKLAMNGVLPSYSPLLVDAEGGLHVIRRDRQGEVPHGQIITFHERSTCRPVLQKNILDLLQAITHTQHIQREKQSTRRARTRISVYQPSWVRVSCYRDRPQAKNNPVTRLSR